MTSDANNVFLYLTTTGRTSGEPRQIEIWFVEHDGCYYMVAESGDQAHWVRNIMANPLVTFSIGTRENHAAHRPPTRAGGRILPPEDDPALVSTIAALMDAKYGWSTGLTVELIPHEG